MTLGEKIKFVRQQKKMSQLTLSKAANIHQKNISKYENDGVVPSAITINEIAKALGVTTDYLLGNEQENTIKDKHLLKHFKDIDNLPENLKAPLITVIEAYIQNFKAKQALHS